MSPIRTRGADLPANAGHVPGRDHTELSAHLNYLARAFKAPTIGAVWAELADTARDRGWPHEEYLAAVLARQVADREANGTQLRIAAPTFPPSKVWRTQPRPPTRPAPRRRRAPPPPRSSQPPATSSCSTQR